MVVRDEAQSYVMAHTVPGDTPVAFIPIGQIFL